MKSLTNIEKSGFHRGEYVGYGGNTVWRITGHSGAWKATPRDMSPVLRSPRLEELSLQLEKLNTKPARVPVDELGAAFDRANGLPA